MSKKDKLLSTSAVYLVSSILGQVINLFLVPIYTNKLTKSEYGQFNIVLSIQSLLTIIVTLGIYTGLTRFFNEYKNKNNLKNTAFTFSLIWGAVFSLLVYLLSKPLASVIFREDPLGAQYINYTVISAVLLCLISIYNMYYSMQYRAVVSSLITVARMVLTLGFTVLLMIKIDNGIIGALQAMLITYALLVLALVITDIKNFRFRFCKKELKDMLSYGIALAPGQVSSWVLNLIDRYFIKGMISLSAVGVYSVGYKVGTLLDPVFIVPFRSAFAPYKFDVYKQEGGNERIRDVYGYFNLIGWFLIVGLSLFANVAIRILSNKGYAEAYKIVPLIAFSYYLWGLVEFYGFGLHVANKMIISSMIVFISALLNVVFNYILIHYFGINGATLATILCYFIANILYYIFGQKYYKLPLKIVDSIKYLPLFLIVYGVYYFIKPSIDNLLLEILLSSLLCVIYIGLNIAFKFISIDTIKKFINFIKKKGR
jgi:O-antigen/teichoic acid export membrane protein